MIYSPKLLVSLSLQFTALLSAIVLGVILMQPYAGFVLEYDEGSDIMRVAQVDSWVETQGLRLEDGIESIANSSGLLVRPGPQHVLRSAGEARQYFANRSERLNEVDRMHRLLSEGSIHLVLEDGSMVDLTLDRRRPLGSLSLTVWASALIALSAPLISALVWSWQSDRTEAILLLMTGIAFFCFSFSSAVSIYTIDMFYLPVFLHWIMRTVLDIGQLSFAALGAAILLYYPNRLDFAGRGLSLIILGLIIYPLMAYLSGWSIADWEQGVYPSFTDAESYSPMFFSFSLILFLSWKQYRKSEKYPVQRAQTLWMILAWTLGPSVFLTLYVLPRWLGDGPILRGGEFINLTILTTYLMILVGIARLNLFHLEQYISQAYHWITVSLLFFAFDIALVTLVNLSPELSGIITLIVVLWIYLPARQWLSSRLILERNSRVQELMNEAVLLMVNKSLDSSVSPQSTWKETLGLLFRPAAIAELEAPVDTRVEGRGQRLLISANRHCPSFELDFKESGLQLFDKNDARLAETASLLFEKLYDARDAFLLGQSQERSRIRRDLHDQVGHKLLSLIYAAKDDSSRQLAQDTMTQLSELIQALDQKSIGLGDLATRVHVLCEDICRHANLVLRWENALSPESAYKISSDQFLNILNIVRELLSNSVKHASAKQISLALRSESGCLAIDYADDGSGFDQQEITPGNGLFNMQSRAAELGASMEWETEGGTAVSIKLPLIPRSNADG